eukprot:848664-Amphidinium_carterae.1
MESREHVLKAVRQSWKALEHVDEVWKSDREVVLTAVRQYDVRALRFAAQALMGDREFVLEAVQKSGRALQYATEALRSDREVVIAAVRQKCNESALRYATEALRADREVVLLAVQNWGCALQYATEALRADPEVAQAAVQQEAEALRYAADDLLEDPSFATEAKKERHLLKLTMLSGRSTVVVSRRSWNVEIVLDVCRKRLGLSDEGATMELWHASGMVSADAE